MLDKLNIKNGLLCFGLMAIIFQAKAEVLVILPESGPMARAGNSIKMGIDSAHQASKANIQLKYVNSDQKSIARLLKDNLTASTQLVIGPLARTDLENLFKENLKIPVLALNEINKTKTNVWQYSLSKDDDANALIRVINTDKIQHLYVIREKGSEKDSLSFVNALYQKFEGQVSIVDEIPRLKRNQGVLLLGGNVWVNQLPNKPKKLLYAQAISLEDQQSIPQGLKFCDVSALHTRQWKELTDLTLKNPTSMAYQRLYAFGGDAWHIAEKFVLNPNLKSFKFSGSTGDIKIESQRVERTPQCFENKRKGLVVL